MGKGKGKGGQEAKNVQAIDGPKEYPELSFPQVGGVRKPRRLGTPETLAADQIVLYSDVLTGEECDSLVRLFADGKASSSAWTMQASPPAKKGEAERTNFRFSTVSPSFAKQLYTATGLDDVVGAWPSMFPRSGAKAVGLSSNIRIYRYDPGAMFACHYDDHSVDPHYGPRWGRTEWTLLIYLTGEPDVQGGQTVFYKGHVRPKNGMQSDNAIVAPLRKGAAVLHRHGKVCMLHEALPPTKGTKWVLRSDVVFGPC